MTEPAAVRRPRLLVRLLAVVISTVATLGVAELVLRAMSPADGLDSAKPSLTALCGDCPYKYGLNREHPGMTPWGTRSTGLLSSGTGARRVLFLGDSVAFGVGVPRPFPAVLQWQTSSPARRIEVLNAAAPGYTAYNSVQYYLAEGRKHRAPVVVFAMCLNDIADPILHWREVHTDQLLDAPAAAIPNPRYHRSAIVPKLNRIRRWDWLGARSEIARRFGERFVWPSLRPPLTPGTHPPIESYSTEIEGRRWPTYLSIEDSLSIEVVMDETSPESVWLRQQLLELKAAVSADGARLAVVFLPLSYQLDPGYPFIPQDNLMRFCAERSIPCLDLLPTLRAHPAERVFGLDKVKDLYDIWHLTPFGHGEVASAIASFLQSEGLIARDPGAQQ